MAMRASIPWLACALLFACSERIDVLAPRAELAPQQPFDGSILRPPDDFDPITHDADLPETPCGECAAGELCVVDECKPARGITALSSSLAHSCEIADGRLFCWGNNEQGQLGVGDHELRDRRTRVGAWNDWLDVCTGEEHSCAIRAPGDLYCFGDNGLGQLGLGDTQPRLAPVALGSGTLFTSIACGGDSSCAIDEDGKLWCWGDNLEGKPGQDDPFSAPDVTRPAPVGSARFQKVAVGQGHVCAIDSDGALFCWGRNTNGQLGIGLEPEQLRAPMRVGDATNWNDIAASQHSSCGVRDDGSLWCWGQNVEMELATPEIDAKFPEPHEIGAGLGFRGVETGWFHTCGVRKTGELLCWGRAIEGQLGQGGGDPVSVPGPVTGPGAAADWQHVALGNFHSCGASSDGVLMCWGAAETGQLGLGDTDRRSEPTPVP